MNYCDHNDVWTVRAKHFVIGELKNDNETEQDALNRLDQIINETSRLIDGFLAAVIPAAELPLNDVPPVIRRICADIVAYKACTRKGIPENDFVSLEKQYLHAMKILQQISTNKINIFLEHETLYIPKSRSISIFDTNFVGF